MTRYVKIAFASAATVAGFSLFACGGDSSSGASTEAEETVGVCGIYTAYADGLGNTHCLDASTGAVVYSVLADGSIVYATSGATSSSTVVVDPTDPSDTTAILPNSSSGTETVPVCGETSSPTSVVGNFYFYSDALGSYYYDVTDPTCTKNYLNAVPSSSSAASSSSAVLNPESSAGYTISSSTVISNGNSPTLSFNGESLVIENDNNCIDTSGTVVRISCAGEYNLQGTTSNYEILVSADTSAKVYLYLNNLALTSPNDAAIYVQSADKVFLMLTDGSTNSLTDASTRTIVWNYTTAEGEAKSDTTGGVVYSKKDLTIKGAGSLTVTSACADTSVCGNGIHTTKDLKVKGNPTITVSAKKNALKGKRSVEVEGGEISLTSAYGDGIKSDEDDAEKLADGKGFVKVLGGTFVITAANDGIQASNYVLVADSVSTPSFTITTGTGTANTSSSEGGQGGGGHGGMGNMGGWGWSSSSSSDDGESVKGIKADSLVNILAGNFIIKAEGDAVHSNHVVKIDGGTLSVSGRNGIHADDSVIVNNGTFLVTDCYEGFEGKYIVLNGGYTSVYATDDGWNASSGNQQEGTLYVNGGTHIVYAGGDGLDSNGDFYMAGGFVLVQQSGSGGNGILDIGDNGYTLSYTGGILVGVGTADMGIGSQISGSYSGYVTLGASAGALVSVADASGNVVAAFNLSSKSSAAAGLFMVPNSSSYSFYVGGTFSGSMTLDPGETDISYAASGTVSGGTQKSGSSSGGRF